MSVNSHKLPDQVYSLLNVDQFLEEVKELNPKVNLELLRNAYIFSDDAHHDQKRASGEKYIVHSINVALILAGQNLDSTTIAAGLLHDVAEDTKIAIDDIRKKFGNEMAELVDGVTRISTYQARTSLETKAEYFRKMLLSMAKDIRVILIKLADRLHNMRTLQYLPPDKQRKVAQETYDVYAPIAHRLGMAMIKRELEDLSLKYIHPDEYTFIWTRLNDTLVMRESDIKNIVEPLRNELQKNKIKAEIYGRAKSIDSIHRKMIEKERSFEEIYDLFAIRIIVESVHDCYHALGVVHMMFVPVGGFDDYIAKPKQNGYQSLHTNVIGPEGNVVEIQIRTLEMHNRAEYGIASHWIYKEGKQGIKEADKRLNWLREVLDWQKDMTNPAEFLEYLKIDLYHDEVFVFTPTGELKHLPVESTVLDFAFAVHSEIGFRCAGAKVNGKLVPLSTVLQSGDEVEITTAPGKQPSRDWLKIVRTSGARSKIRRFLKQKDFERSRQAGHEMLERHAKRMRLEVPSDKELQKCAESFSFKSIDAFLAALGQGDVSLMTAVNRLYPHVQEEVTTSLEEIISGRRSGLSGIRIDDIRSVQFRYGQCCQPVPGEEVIGFITRGRGMTVHRANCANISRINIDRERIVKLEWDVSEKSSFVVKINLVMEDRKNILRDVLNSLADDDTNLKNTSISASKGMARGEFIAEVKNLSHLNQVLDRIRKVRGVIDVSRSMGSSRSEK